MNAWVDRVPSLIEPGIPDSRAARHWQKSSLETSILRDACRSLLNAAGKTIRSMTTTTRREQ